MLVHTRLLWLRRWLTIFMKVWGVMRFIRIIFLFSRNFVKCGSSQHRLLIRKRSASNDIRLHNNRNLVDDATTETETVHGTLTMLVHTRLLWLRKWLTIFMKVGNVLRFIRIIFRFCWNFVKCRSSQHHFHIRKRSASNDIHLHNHNNWCRRGAGMWLHQHVVKYAQSHQVSWQQVHGRFGEMWPNTGQ